MKLHGYNNYIARIIIMMQSHYSSFSFWFLKIRSAFGNQDKTTFPLAQSSNEGIKDETIQLDNRDYHKQSLCFPRVHDNNSTMAHILLIYGVRAGLVAEVHWVGLMYQFPGSSGSGQFLKNSSAFGTHSCQKSVSLCIYPFNVHIFLVGVWCEGAHTKIWVHHININPQRIIKNGAYLQGTHEHCRVHRDGLLSTWMCL